MYEGYDPQRIGLKAEWLIEFIKLHNKDHPDAKYKIGDKVLYCNLDVTSNGLIIDEEIVCEILAVNVQDKDQVEYAISNVYANLVWEEELT